MNEKPSVGGRKDESAAQSCYFLGETIKKIYHLKLRASNVVVGHPSGAVYVCFHLCWLLTLLAVVFGINIPGQPAEDETRVLVGRRAINLPTIHIL